MLRLSARLAGITVAGLLIGCVPTPAPPPAPPAGSGSATTEHVDAPEMGAAPETSAGQEGSNPDTSAAGYETPAAVFAVAHDAAAAGDWRVVAGCLTPDSQEFLLVMGRMAAAYGGDQFADLRSALETHGLDVDDPDAPVPESGDLPTIAGDLMAVLVKSGLAEGNGGPTAWGRAELTSLRTREGLASATLTYPGQGPSGNEPVAFVSNGDGWLIDPARYGPAEDKPLPETPLEEGVTTRVVVSTRRPAGSMLPQDLPEGTLYVTLELTGELVPAIYEYGEFQLLAATDDTGAKLELAAPVLSAFQNDLAAGLVPLSSLHGPRHGDTLPIHFALTAPGEDAQRLAALELSLKLKVGTSVLVDNVLDTVGGAIDVEKLAHIGELSFSRPDSEDGGQWAVIELRGPMDLLQGVTLLDGDGREVPAYGSFSTPWSFGFQTDAELPEDLRMRITLGDAESVQVARLTFTDLEW